MKRRLPRKIYTTVIILAILLIGSGISHGFYAQSFLKKAESALTFPKNLNTPDVDFDLQSTGKKRFKIVLNKKIDHATTVKIFDIVGNLIKEDHLEPEDGNQKSYDFSHIKSQLFVVEVGNSKYNKTKSIYANPPGQKQKAADDDKPTAAKE